MQERIRALKGIMRVLKRPSLHWARAFVGPIVRHKLQRKAMGTLELWDVIVIAAQKSEQNGTFFASFWHENHRNTCD